MGMTVTKKQGGKRVAKKLNKWWTLNKTTPDRWFEVWEFYTTSLMLEIGFSIDSSGILNKPKRKLWTMQLEFSHPKIGKYTILLCRKKSQPGGDVCLLYHPKGHQPSHYALKNCSTTIETTITDPKSQNLMMCRTTVGNKILETIRENWEKQFEPTNEKT